MPRQRRKRKPDLRIATEKSDPYTDANMRKASPALQRMRNAHNRIHELEQQIAKLSVTGKGTTIAFEISHQARQVLETLTNTGFYGLTPELTAGEILVRALRSEMAWLATGHPS